jgi:DNA-binding NtrC family response regulator
MRSKGMTQPRAAKPGATVLILSADAVGAALLGALIETLGYEIRFAEPAESGDQSLRRVRPHVCLVDCVEPAACSDGLLGRARMRGVSVVIFGTPDALERVRALTLEHDIDTLMMPANAEALDETIQRALRKVG